MTLGPLGTRTLLAEDPVHRALLRIVRHAAETGTPLPNEYDLAERLGCGRQQVRHALGALETAGVIRRRQGTPTTVDQMGLQMSVRLEDQFEHTELLARLGYEATVEILETEIALLPARVAALLGVERDGEGEKKGAGKAGDPPMISVHRVLLLLSPASDADFPSCSPRCRRPEGQATSAEPSGRRP